MTLSVSQMTTKVRKDTGIDSSDLSDAEILLNLNLSWWEIAGKIEFREMEQTLTFNTVLGQILYPAPNPYEAVQSLSIEDPNSKKHVPLRFMDVAEYENEYVNKTESRGMPTRFYRENNNIGLWPTPDAVYPIIEKYLIPLADLVVVAPPVAQKWHEPILFGGIYRSFLDVGDRVNAAYFNKMQASMINTTPETKAIEEKTTMKWAGVSVPRRWPDDSPISGRRIN